MAEAPTDQSTTRDNLEQKILQVLSDAGVPVKTAQLVKECQVPKKFLNQVLYSLKKEARVSLEAPATWRLGGGAPGDGVPLVPKVPEVSAAQSSFEEQIYRFLEAKGPCKALHIAQALGLKTAKDVNPDLYAMRNRHLLNYDGQIWTTCGSNQGSGMRGHGSDWDGQGSPAAIIYQQNPINMICQQGANSHISIANSEAIRIGHGNFIQSHTAFGDTGLRTPHHLPLPVPGDPSAQGTPLGAWGTQDIYMEKSMLRRVQLGHGNQMSLLRGPREGPTYSFSGSPPVSAPDTSPEASFNVQTPEPGPHPEGDMTQRIHIKSCFLEDTTIGNSNKMTVHPGSEGPGGVTGSGGGKEPKEDTGPSSDTTPYRSCFQNPSSMPLTSELREDVTLEDRGSQTVEPTLGENAAPIIGSEQPKA
uniref:Z-DNA-binding protein 1 n=1 Tax=Nannospalax galili TaxID=1026970 RepID=A0A8C6RZY3_NANGA